jgi:DNA polymerase III gamma/tau subunit
MTEPNAVELYRKYRPTKFSEVVGQSDAVKTLVDMGKRKALPHFILFTGPSGCGKTTIARILRQKLKCSDSDFSEVNAANDRGIDMVRDIEKKMNYAPIGGKCRLWLCDECFPAGTMVDTPLGFSEIQNIKKNQWVNTISGPSQVKNTFTNRVELSRIVRVHFQGGHSVVTTKQHEFLTEEGWIEVSNLEIGDCVLSDSCYLMGSGSTNSNRMNHDAHRKEMPDLQKDISGKDEQAENLLPSMCLQVENQDLREGALYKEEETTSDSRVCLVPEEICEEVFGKENTGMLFQELCIESKSTKNGTRTDRREKMLGMWKGFCGEGVRCQEILQSVLCSQEQDETTRDTGKFVQRGGEKEDKRIAQEIRTNRKRKKTSECVFIEDEENQPNAETTSNREDEGDKSKERHLTCILRRERRKWAIHETSVDSLQCPGIRLGIGIAHQNWMQNILSNLLQSGHRQPEIDDSNRSRWENAQIEKGYVKRCKENEEARVLRVDRIEVYQPGNNDKSFSGVVTDRDRDREFVEFYDLEIDGHPSYFADGIPVHNCHQLTTAAQSSFLKILEDTPDWVYFIFCTTDPQKLKKTVRTRATTINLNSVGDLAMSSLIQRVAKAENKTVDEEVVDKIVGMADGSPRQALVLYGQVIGLPANDQIELLKSTVPEKEGIDLARLLLKESTSWTSVAKTLKAIEGLDEKAESIRWLVMGYMSSVALKSPKQAGRAVYVIDAFSHPFYDTKKAGLISACFDAMGD